MNKINKETKRFVNPSEGNIKGKSAQNKKDAISFAIEFFIKVGVTAFVICVLLFFVVGVYANHSNSSYPMLKDGDLCFTYKLGKLQTGDEIAYKQEGKMHFGRIVATEGDIVDIKDGTVAVNGYSVFENTIYPTTAEGATVAFPYTVPTGTVFVLNDYRDDIQDSRVYGSIPKKQMRGKVVLVLRRRGI